MNARVIIAGNNRRFPADAAQSCAAYITQMARPDCPPGLEPAARPAFGGRRAATYSYDLTAGRWVVPPSSLTRRDAVAAAEPLHNSEHQHSDNDVITQPHTDYKKLVVVSNPTTSFFDQAVEVATVVGGMAAFSGIAFVVLLLA